MEFTAIAGGSVCDLLRSVNTTPKTSTNPWLIEAAAASFANFQPIRGIY